MSVYDYKIKGFSKPFVDIVYSTTEFKMMAFVLYVRVTLS